MFLGRKGLSVAAAGCRYQQMMNDPLTTTCIVVGGGPAGMILGLLMARAGVEVTVLEKHADFIRDFRGDTVHASTLTLLDELGLGERFAAIPHRLLDRILVQFDAGTVQVVDLRRLPGRHQHIGLVPQWDFLELIAAAAREEPTFRLIRNAEVTALLHDGHRIAGVRWVDRTSGVEQDMRAALTVGCDGRESVVRKASGVRARSFGVPIDVWWFRLPRDAGDPEGGFARFSSRNFCLMLDRGAYWQCAYLIGKGRDQALRAAGIDQLHRSLVSLLPWMAGRVDHLASWDDVKLLNVQLNRVRRWDRDGLLLIGDAAHAMSPVGGFGINLAVADAVAAARLLSPALRSGDILPPRLLRRVQRRRWWTTALLQGVQQIAHKVAANYAHAQQDFGPPNVAESSAGSPSSPASTSRLPLPVRVLQRWPILQCIPGWLVAIGPRPEHAPDWARRAPMAAMH